MKLLTVALLLLLCSTQEPLETEIPELGSVTMPAGDWTLEKSHIPKNDKTPVAFIFRKNGKVVERITILRYRKSESVGERRMTLEDSSAFCDSIADSMELGVPSFLQANKPSKKESSKKTNALPELSGIHMIRLPHKGHKEPLAVTNIYPDDQENNWMNHGLIASNKKHVFVFVHSAPRVLSPETVESVYWSSGLGNQPDRKKSVGKK